MVSSLTGRAGGEDGGADGIAGVRAAAAFAIGILLCMTVSKDHYPASLTSTGYVNEACAFLPTRGPLSAILPDHRRACARR